MYNYAITKGKEKDKAEGTVSIKTGKGLLAEHVKKWYTLWVSRI